MGGVAMALVTTNKLLFCCISFFSQALCMEVVGLQSLSKDMIQHIGTQLTFVGRKNMKSSCMYMYVLCNKEPLFLSPFSAENYDNIMKHSCGCLPLSHMASAYTRMKLKVYAARQRSWDMFFDLLSKDPVVCDDTVCLFTYHKKYSKEEDNKTLISLYAKEWKCNGQGNKDHFEALMSATQMDCRCEIDLLLAQGIDVNATNEDGYTVLHQICELGGYSWATRKLVSNALCNVNVRSHKAYWTPLHMAAFKVSYNNIRILLTCDNVAINAEDVFNNTALSYVVEWPYHYCRNFVPQLLLTCDGIKENGEKR